MSVKKSLWGDIPLPENERTPFTILQEQAEILGEQTNDKLQGRVRRVRREDRSECFFYLLEISVPALDGYSFGVLIIYYKIMTIYPVSIIDLVHDQNYEFETEDQFVDMLGQILSSDEVRKVIQRLLSQLSIEKPAHGDEIEE
ncbi:hypothetical protein QUF72_15600 [Desulfobacterales bacterium HSG2]|nr:hypothetical protein [Desulfobacterales bacterium HSG2]